MFNHGIIFIVDYFFSLGSATVSWLSCQGQQHIHNYQRSNISARHALVGTGAFYRAHISSALFDLEEREHWIVLSIVFCTRLFVKETRIYIGNLKSAVCESSVHCCSWPRPRVPTTCMIYIQCNCNTVHLVGYIFANTTIFPRFC